MLAKLSFSTMLLSCVILQGCASVPAGTALALRKIDPMTTDVAQIRVAYMGPDVLRIDADRAKLEIAVNDAGPAAALKQTFALEAASPVDVPGGSAIAVEPGMIVRFFKLPQEEAARLERTRAIIAAGRASGGGGKGTISVSADGCLEHPTMEPLPISAYLRTEETERFVPLFERMNLRDIVKAKGLTLDVCKK